MKYNLTNDQIEVRLRMLEVMIAGETDGKSLQALTATYNRLMDVIVQREVDKGEPSHASH